MYDALFPDQTISTLSVELPPRAKARGLFDNLGSAIIGAPRAALGETGRALEGFQQTVMPGLMTAVDEPRQRAREAGINFPSLSESMGRDIKRFTPDPATTGEASQIVFGVGKVLAKAIPLGVIGGMPLAAAGTGLIEGTSEAQRLGDEGVDPTTAAKVGAVRAVSTAAGIALPVAGRTLAQTAALVIGGGPASFMVEQQASKMILDSADYGKIAEQYNPFDPVGLAVATLIPSVVGAAAHGARSLRGADAKTGDYVPTPEEQAAARVTQTAEHVQQTALSRPGDVAGAAAHVDAMELAQRQIDAGERVSVGAIIRQVMDEQAARVAAEERPAFLRTADDLIALKQQERPYLTPDLERAIEVARTPGAFRSQEDRIFLAGMMDETVPTRPAEAPRSEPAAAVKAETPAEAQAPARNAPDASAKAPDPLETSARQIAEQAPDMKVADEFTGKESGAAQLLDDADAEFAKDTQEAGAYQAAITCFLRH